MHIQQGIIISNVSINIQLLQCVMGRGYENIPIFTKSLQTKSHSCLLIIITKLGESKILCSV